MGRGILIAWIDKRIVASSKKSSNPLLGGSVADGWLNDEGIVLMKNRQIQIPVNVVELDSL
jgi:hypothetical protein